MGAPPHKEKTKAIEKATFIIGIASLLITLVYGAWGLSLSIEQTKLSHKQDTTSITIDTFKKLLLKTDVLISKQSELISLYKTELGDQQRLLCKTDTVVSLSFSQLLVHQRVQSNTNINQELKAIGDESKLYAALEKIHLMLWKINRPYKLSDNDSIARFSFVNNMKAILESQMDNPFLVSKKEIYNDWVTDYLRFNNFILSCDFSITPNDSLEKKWQGCFISMTDLDQNLYTAIVCDFCGGKNLKNKNKKNVEQQYILIRGQRNGESKTSRSINSKL